MSKEFDKIDYGVIYSLLIEKISLKEFIPLEYVPPITLDKKITDKQRTAIIDRNNQKIKQHKEQLKNDTYYADLIRLKYKIKKLGVKDD